MIASALSLAIFTIVLSLSTIAQDKDFSNSKGQAESARPPSPTPTPSPTPIPGCATTAANTNFWGGSGGLDTTFGTGGMTTFYASAPITGTETVKKVLIQTDGKIVTVGHARNPAGLTGTTDMLVIRFNQNGGVDATFGTPDPANIGQRLGYIFVDFSLGSDMFAGGALDSAGRILIASWYNAKVARLTIDGDLDLTFGTAGKIETPVPNLTPVTMAVLDSGKIVLAGGEPNFTMARFNDNGSLDTTFGTNGSVSISISGAKRGKASANSVTTQWISGEERLVLGGWSMSGATANSTFALMRFRAGGQVDTTFANNGVALTSFFGAGDLINHHTIDASNRIVAVGQVYTPCGRDAGFARYSESGVLDASFSGDGKFTQDIYGGGNVMNTVIMQNGNILAGGWANNAAGTESDFAMMRLDQTGTPDASFGPGFLLGNGIVTTNAGTIYDNASGLALDLNGNIVLGGRGNGSVVARYIP